MPDPLDLAALAKEYFDAISAHRLRCSTPDDYAIWRSFSKASLVAALQRVQAETREADAKIVDEFGEGTLAKEYGPSVLVAAEVKRRIAAALRAQEAP